VPCSCSSRLERGVSSETASVGRDAEEGVCAVLSTEMYADDAWLGASDVWCEAVRGLKPDVRVSDVGIEVLACKAAMAKNTAKGVLSWVCCVDVLW
jgi:hypothetical protein